MYEDVQIARNVILGRSGRTFPPSVCRAVAGLEKLANSRLWGPPRKTSNISPARTFPNHRAISC